MCQSLSVNPADIAEEIAAMPHHIGLYLSIDELKRHIPQYSLKRPKANNISYQRLN